MKDYTRRAVAYIAGRVISNKDTQALYDENDSQYFNFSGEVGTPLSIYDYAQKCFINGLKKENAFSLYHSGNRKHISFEVNDNQFTGYDYDSEKTFSGNVNENVIFIYDYENNKYFHYRL
jgi:hypothetical protein